MKFGVLLAIITYTIWGLFPVYFHWLAAVAPLRVVAARIVSSFVLLVVLMLASRHLRGNWRPLFRARTLLIYSAAALLISLNWLVFVWTVSHQRILEASLGYFINPLLSVFMGVLWFHESLRKGQWLAIFLAAIGVLYLTVAFGHPPWIALALALSFSLYGLLKKCAPLDPLQGLTLETGLLLAPALWYLSGRHGVGSTGRLPLSVDILLVASGAVTALPLWMFANAAQRIPLAVLGMLQYITPTLQFLVGIALYHEPFPYTDRLGFSIVWLALCLFVTEGFWMRRRRPAY